MKPSKNLYLFITFALVMCFAISCKKEKSLSNESMLTGKNWKVVGYTVDPGLSINGTIVTNLYEQFDPCVKDDIFNCKTDRTYTMEEGLIKCSVDDPQVYESGTWTFNSDETVLILTTSGGIMTNYNLENLSSTEIVLKTEVFIDNLKYITTTTYNLEK